MSNILEINGIKFDARVSGAGAGVELSLTPKLEGEVIMVELEVRSQSPVIFPEVTLDAHFPFVDTHNLWTPCPHGNPKAMRNKGIPEWWPYYSSHISHVAPVGCFYSQNSENRIAFAFSDSKNIVNVHAGAYEEEEAGRIRMRLFSVPGAEMQEYKGTLRLDTRDIPVFDAIASMADWHEEVIGDSQMPVPEAALEPVYSTWYSFHQNLFQDEIEAQCRLAAEAGCKTIILDDGWQTDDSNRGYKYCGDWKVAQSRFPDFAGHVERVQDMGMKYMLWLSVPFIGRGCEVWNEYKDNLLFYCEGKQAGTLDPRYPKVRQYLIDTFCRVVRDYNLDGLKLDFIDEFDMTHAEGNALKPDSARDTESLPAAVDILMMSVRESLEAINPEIMIEFRQRYIGSMIRKYGNIFRVHDCPNDPITNRMSILDLRAFSGNTAVHSDMFIWSSEDTAESASLHFINTLFGVPQISPNMRTLSDEHRQMTRHWLNFWSERKSLLMGGKIKTRSPEMHYPVAESQLGEAKLIAVYSEVPCEIFNSGDTHVTIVNGSMKGSVLIRSHQQATISTVTFDCLGNVVGKDLLEVSEGLSEMSMPKSGYVEITKLS